jgi:hypothetical protein
LHSSFFGPPKRNLARLMASTSPFESGAPPKNVESGDHTTGAASGDAPKGSPTTSSPAKKPVVKKQKVPPPGFKYVKVQRDGKLVTVQRRLTPEEIAAAEAKKESSDVSSPSAGKVASKDKKTTTKKSPDTTTAAPSSPSPSKEPIASGPTAQKKDAAEESASSPVTPPSKAEIEEQAIANREKRTRRMKRSLYSGLIRVIGVAAPIDIGTWHEDDQIVDDADSDDSWGDGDDDDDDNNDDGHDNNAEVHGGNDPEKDHISSANHEGAQVHLNSTGIADVLAARVAAGSDEKKPVPASTPAAEIEKKSASEKKPESEKTTYINVKEIQQQLDEKAAEERSLRRHWQNFSFYLLASLSIVLPLLFLGE